MVDYYREYQLEMERHRKTWTQLEQVKGLLRDLRAVACDAGYYDLAARIDAALSLQTEPVEPAPAQDELIPRNQAIAEAFREGVEWQRNRPARTFPQPEQSVLVPEGYVLLPKQCPSWLEDVYDVSCQGAGCLFLPAYDAMVNALEEHQKELLNNG